METFTKKGADKIAEQSEEIVRLKRERDELLAALQAIVDLDDGDKPDLWHFEKEFEAARSAIIKATS